MQESATNHLSACVLQVEQSWSTGGAEVENAEMIEGQEHYSLPSRLRLREWIGTPRALISHRSRGASLTLDDL